MKVHPRHYTLYHRIILRGRHSFAFAKISALCPLTFAAQLCGCGNLRTRSALFRRLPDSAQMLFLLDTHPHALYVGKWDVACPALPPASIPTTYTLPGGIR